MIEFRAEKEDDNKAVYEVNRLAFGQEEEAGLVDRLRTSKHYVPGLSLVATRDGEVVGHILFTKVDVKSKKDIPGVLALATLAVKPDSQKQGIGSGLVTEGLKACKGMGYRAVIVIGHPEFYPRFGFSSARAKGLKAKFLVASEAFMAIELVPGSLAGTGGTVVFPSELAEFEVLSPGLVLMFMKVKLDGFIHRVFR